MKRTDFESGISRLVGIFGNGITPALVAELNTRYGGASSRDWDALISRVLENCKSAPRLAHFRDHETGIATFTSDSERLRRTCGLCDGGFVRRFARVGTLPYEVLVPCPCSPDRVSRRDQSGAPLVFIDRAEFDELRSAVVQRGAEESQQARDSDRSKRSARHKLTKKDADDAENEAREERRAIQAESVRAEIEANGIPADF